jgi:hypothetical protein
MSAVISYSHKDRELADMLRRTLSEVPIEVLGDFSDFSATARFAPDPSEMMRSANAYILLLTPAFLASNWCRHELDLVLQEARRSQKGIIPFVTTDVRSEDIPPILRNLEFVQLSCGDDAQQTFRAHLRRSLNLEFS